MESRYGHGKHPESPSPPTEDASWWSHLASAVSFLGLIKSDKCSPYRSPLPTEAVYKRQRRGKIKPLEKLSKPASNCQNFWEISSPTYFRKIYLHNFFYFLGNLFLSGCGDAILNRRTVQLSLILVWWLTLLSWLLFLYTHLPYPLPYFKEDSASALISAGEGRGPDGQCGQEDPQCMTLTFKLSELMPTVGVLTRSQISWSNRGADRSSSILGLENDTLLGWGGGTEVCSSWPGLRGCLAFTQQEVWRLFSMTTSRVLVCPEARGLQGCGDFRQPGQLAL